MGKLRPDKDPDLFRSETRLSGQGWRAGEGTGQMLMRMDVRTGQADLSDTTAISILFADFYVTAGREGTTGTTSGFVKMTPTDAQKKWNSKMRMSGEALDCLEKGCTECDTNFSDARKSDPHGGTVHFNGRPRDKLFQRISAYEDQMPKYLTVTEAWRMACACEMNGESMKSLPCQLPHSTTAVEFNGMLKLWKFERPSMVSKSMAQQWIQRRLEDTYIGDGTSLRGISGGQKRRLSLAKRLASGSQVFFCDEPTSGLSATDAEACIRYMKHIARFYNVIVLVVIHQPRIEVAQLFDELVLMTANPGRAVYNGKMEDVEDYLHQVGFDVPMHANPVDFFMDLVTPDASNSQVDLFVEQYRDRLEPRVLREVERGAVGQKAPTKAENEDSAATRERRDRWPWFGLGLELEMPSALDLLENVRAQMLESLGACSFSAFHCPRAESVGGGDRDAVARPGSRLGFHEGNLGGRELGRVGKDVTKKPGV
ncbi:unnamed protein product [Durusdinium trenchii]|uniref:ABC transporter domain-containing protein n=1 Tax=Durusdinium trenchii TaxID=1381693 RepID=A0ABP0R5H2_9DINO